IAFLIVSPTIAWKASSEERARRRKEGVNFFQPAMVPQGPQEEHLVTVPGAPTYTLSGMADAYASYRELEGPAARGEQFAKLAAYVGAIQSGAYKSLKDRITEQELVFYLGDPTNLVTDPK